MEVIQTKHGRGISATKEYNAGDIILREQPLVAVVEKNICNENNLNGNNVFACEDFSPNALTNFVKNTKDIRREMIHFAGPAGKLLQKVNMNCFTLTLLDGTQYGHALYKQATLFNHSCEPNAGWVFNGVEILIIANKKIEPDTEITTQYIPVMQYQTNVRREFLSKLGFNCECSACLADGTKVNEQWKDFVTTMLEIMKGEIQTSTMLIMASNYFRVSPCIYEVRDMNRRMFQLRKMWLVTAYYKKNPNINVIAHRFFDDFNDKFTICDAAYYILCKDGYLRKVFREVNGQRVYVNALEEFDTIKLQVELTRRYGEKRS